MRAEEVKGLIEAYSQVYETPEVLSEGVSEDVEQLDEQGRSSGANPSQVNQSVRIPGGRTVTRVMGDLPRSLSAAGKVPTYSGPRNVRGGGRVSPSAKPAAPAAAKPAPAKPAPEKPAPAKPSPSGSGIVPTSAKPVPTSTPRPAPTPVAKPAPTATAKPAATPAAKPAGSAMDQWAKANPKLAAAKAERERTRGTSATTNPLMKDMKSSLPAPKPLASGMDIFDLVKGYLLDEGYAETEENAVVIMVNMSEEWRNSIVESLQK